MSLPRQDRSDRRLTIDTPLGSTKFIVRRFETDEALSALFRLRVQLSAPRASTSLPIHELLGQPVTLHWKGASATRHWNGIVNEVAEHELGHEADSADFDVEVVPALWLSTRRVRSRVFQRQSVPDILKTVLAGLRPDVEFHVRADYPVRNYCVQYRESDFDFMSRLMEDEGISYYFRHELVPPDPQGTKTQRADAYRHVLVVTDDANVFRALPDLADLTYDPSVQAGPGAERIQSWTTIQKVQRQLFTLRDQHFELSDSDARRRLRILESNMHVAGEVRLGRTSKPLTVKPLRPDAEPLELFEHGTGLARRFETEGIGNLTGIFDDQKRMAKVREEEECAAAIRVEGTASYAHLAPGHKVQVGRLGEKDGTYVLTRVAQEVTQSGSRSAEELRISHQCVFTAVPSGLPVRPARKTPKPRIEGSQTAIVTGTPGKAIDVDKYGRVKVQFHWDRSDQYNQNSSCWVRVSQLWAGNHWGAFFWPRPGMEVIVTFEDGDPDRPLITGCVYNAANMPPPALPAESMTAGIKSCSLSSAPSAPYCAVIFYDDPKNEHVLIHSPNDEAHINKGLSYRYSHGPHMEFVGHLPFTGSGSGGGLMESVIGGLVVGKGKADFVELFGPPAPAAYKYGFNGMLGVNVLGNAVSHNIFGGKVDYCFSPQGLAQMRLMPTSWKAAALLGLPAGACEILVSGKISQIYESDKIEFIRGGNVATYMGGPLDTADQYQMAWAKGLKATLTLLVVSMGAFDVHTMMLGSKYPGLKMDNDPAALKQAMLIAALANLIIERIHAISLALETVYCRLGLSKDALKQVTSDTRSAGQITALNLPQVMEFQHWLKYLVGRIRRRTEQSIANVTRATGAAAGAAAMSAPISTKTKFDGDEEKVSKAGYYHTANGMLTLGALGKSMEDPLASVSVYAAGFDGKHGIISLTADGAIDLECKGARVGIATSDIGRDHTAYISVPRGGDIRLMASTAILPAPPNTVKIDSDGVTITCGMPNVGTKLTMTATEVKVQVGAPPAAGSELTLSATGIRQACGIAEINTSLTAINASVAETRDQIGAAQRAMEALNTRSTAQLQAQIVGLQHSIEATVQAAVKAAMEVKA